MPRFLRSAKSLMSLVTLMGAICYGQDTSGFPIGGHAYATGSLDTIGLATGAITLTIPVRRKAGLIPFDFAITMNSNAHSAGVGLTKLVVTTAVSMGETHNGTLSYTQIFQTCPSGPHQNQQ